MQTTRRPSARAPSIRARTSGATAYASLWIACSSSSLDRDGTERVEPDAQLDADHLAARAQLRPQLGCEVQPRGRGGGRPGPVGVHRLVAPRVRERVAHVRRQRQLSDAGEQVVELGLGNGDAHPPAPGADVLDQLD